MRKKYHNVVRALVVLAMVVALIGAVMAPAAAQTVSITVPSPAQGPVGSPVNIAADNFAPGSILNVTFDGAAVTTAPAVITTNGATEANPGDATFALTVPAATAGAHVISVTDGVNTDTETFTVLAKVSVSPISGAVGSSATVTGTGYAAGYSVNVTIGGVAFTSAVTDSVGGFTATAAVPAGLTAGAQIVTAADLAGTPAPTTANQATFTVKPSLAVSPTSGLAGSTVTVTGSGWEAGSVTLTMGGAPWATVTASGSGAINATLATLATALPGVTQIKGTDTAVNTATTSFTVTARPLTATPSSGPMGTKVLIQASNLTPGPTGNVPAGNVVIASTAWSAAQINIGTSGDLFPTTLTVPAGLTVGINTVRATDNMGLVAAGTFTITRPTAAANPKTGPAGSGVTIQGSGWVPSSTVTLNFCGAPMTVISDANGNIAAAMSVPAVAAGQYSLTAVDGLGNAAIPDTFTVPGATVAVSPAEGAPGTSVTISGTGFAGYAPITVMFGGYTLPTTPLASPLGTFSLATTIPGIIPGSALVQATDGTSVATTFYVVQAAAVTISSQLAGIADELVIVWDYNGGDWLFFDPADAAGSTLDTLASGTGYWVKVSADCELIYGGTSYQLTEGWNNIGWQG
jgi:hypothetical protein